MLINKKEYIVKAKRTSLETYGPQNEKKDKISFFIIWIFTAALCIFFIKPLINMTLILFVILILGIVVILNSKWKLKIEDEKLYIKKGFINYIIEYSDLINVKRRTNQTLDGGTAEKGHFLEIEYMKNNHYKVLNLSYSQKNMESIILEICSLFITNKQLEKYSNISDDYLNIKEA